MNCSDDCASHHNRYDTNRTDDRKDCRQIPASSLVSGPVFRNVNVSDRVRNLVSVNFYGDPRLALGQAIVACVFEHKRPVCARWTLRNLSRDFFELALITQRPYRDHTSLFLGQNLSRLRFGQLMTHTKNFTGAITVDLILLGSFRNVAVEARETNHPTRRHDVNTEQFSVAVGPCGLPDKSVHFGWLSFDATQHGPR